MWRNVTTLRTVQYVTILWNLARIWPKSLSSLIWPWDFCQNMILTWIWALFFTCIVCLISHTHCFLVITWNRIKEVSTKELISSRYIISFFLKHSKKSHLPPPTPMFSQLYFFLHILLSDTCNTNSCNYFPFNSAWQRVFISALLHRLCDMLGNQNICYYFWYVIFPPVTWDYSWGIKPENSQTGF